MRYFPDAEDRMGTPTQAVLGKGIITAHGNILRLQAE